MTDEKNTAEPSGTSGGSTATHIASAVEVYRVESAEGIVDGNYVGEWSGYEVRFETPFGQYVAQLDRGIRGTANCTVRVLHARVTAAIIARRQKDIQWQKT